MTDYQEHIQGIRDRLTPETDKRHLILAHDRLLYIAPRIRIGARWGDYTTYTTMVRPPVAIELTGGELPPDPLGRYRIEMGADERGTVHARLEVWEGKPLYHWEWWDTPETEARVWAWLRKYQPAAEVLLEIDTRLLRMGVTA